MRRDGVRHGLTPQLVHRDLKPANILYDRAADRYRVTDFGIGALTATETLRAETRGGTLAGRLQTYLRGSHTPLYASPQQRAGGPASPQDDVHALGVIAYQLLVGRLDAEVRADYGRQLKRAGVPEAMVELIGDCCAEELGDRPRDAAAVRGRLAGGRAAVVPAAKPASPVATPGAPAAVPVVKPSVPPKPRTWTINIPGRLDIGRAKGSTVEWTEVCTTPAEIMATIDGVYHLNLQSTVTDEALRGLANLADLPNLTSLNLGGTQVTDVGVARVAASLRAITALGLKGTRVTDAGLDQLASSLTALIWLNLCECWQVTEAGVGRLKRALPGCEVRR